MASSHPFYYFEGGIHFERTRLKYTTHVASLIGWGIEDGEEYYIGKNWQGTG